MSASVPSSSSSPRRPNPVALIALITIGTLFALGALAGYLLRQRHQDHVIAAALSEAIVAPRAIFDGRSLETRFDLAVEDLAAERRQSPAQIRAALERFASDDLFAGRRTGYDAFLAQLAARRFEIAIITVNEQAQAAKNSPAGKLPAWRLLTTTGVLEFARGRATAAATLLQQAFDLANRRNELDTPEAANLLTALGAIQLSRSRPDDAEPFLRRATANLRRTPGTDLRDRARTLTHFARSLVQQGFPEEAEPLSSEALHLTAEFRRTTGRSDNDQDIFEENYRHVLRQQGLADAEIDARMKAVR